MSCVPVIGSGIPQKIFYHIGMQNWYGFKAHTFHAADVNSKEDYSAKFGLDPFLIVSKQIAVYSNCIVSDRYVLASITEGVIFCAQSRVLWVQNVKEYDCICKVIWYHTECAATSHTFCFNLAISKPAQDFITLHPFLWWHGHFHVLIKLMSDTKILPLKHYQRFAPQTNIIELTSCSKK